MTIILPFSACLILHDRIGCCNLTSQEIMFSKFTFLNQNLNFLPTQHLSMPNSYPTSFYAQFLPSIFLYPIPTHHLSMPNSYPASFYAQFLPNIFLCPIPTQHLSMPNSYPASFYAQFLYSTKPTANLVSGMEATSSFTKILLFFTNCYTKYPLVKNVPLLVSQMFSIVCLGRNKVIKERLLWLFFSDLNTLWLPSCTVWKFIYSK